MTTIVLHSDDLYVCVENQAVCSSFDSPREFLGACE